MKVKRLDDPRTMRALAHPLRLRLLGLLRSEGPATATTLAGVTGESVASVSYHLRQLAEHGFIEDPPELARNHQERWWRASHERTSWSTVEFLDSPERRAAEGALRREILRQYTRAIEQFHGSEHEWGPRWVDAATMNDHLLELTPDELRALTDELFEVIQKWEARPRREGSERVQVIVQAFPRSRTF